METVLYSYFTQLTRAQLIEILECFGQPFKSSQKKDSLIRSVSAFITGHTAEWLGRLSERDLRFIQKIVDTGAERPVSLDNPEYPTALVNLHLFQVRQYSGDLAFKVSKDIYNVIAPHISEVIKEKENSGEFDVERLLLGYTNMYGVISLRELVFLLEEICGGVKESAKTAYLFATSPVMGMLRHVMDSGEVLLVSPLLSDIDFVLDGRKDFKDFDSFRPYRFPEARGAGLNPPHCLFWNNEAEKLCNTFSALGYSGAEALNEVSLAFINAQYAMTEEGAEMLFEPVNDRMDLIPSFQLYEEYMNTVAAYANSVPKWLLKGRSADEADVTKISIRLEEQSYENSLSDEMGDGMNVQDNPYTAGAIGVPAAGGLSEFFPYGFAFSHVSPEAPCPCGSGLSFRRCHGKNLN